VNSRRYEVLEPIGRGGFGTVYKARFIGEAGFSRLVVLKVLKPGMADIEEVAQRLRDEARMLGHVQHRAVVRVDRLARLGGRWAVVMEHVDGVTLLRLSRRGPVHPGPALEIVSEVASGLHAALHSVGPDGRPLHLLHRDIKPSNVMVTTHGDVKLLDFGIARSDGEREAFTRSLMFGTPEYMAPERFELTDTAAGDVYAMGLVLYELLVGEPLGRTSPRPLKHDALMGRATQALERHEVPAPVVAFTMEMLAFEAEDRPTAADVERRAARLAKEVGGENLRFWAREVVPPLLASPSLLPDDDLRGAVLEESGFTGPSPAEGWGADPGAPATPIGLAASTPAPNTPAPAVSATPATTTPATTPSAGRSWLTWSIAGLSALSVLLCGGLGFGVWTIYQRVTPSTAAPPDPPVTQGGEEPPDPAPVEQSGDQAPVQTPEQTDVASTTPAPTEPSPGATPQPRPRPAGPPPGPLRRARGRRGRLELQPRPLPRRRPRTPGPSSSWARGRPGCSSRPTRIRTPASRSRPAAPGGSAPAPT